MKSNAVLIAVLIFGANVLGLLSAEERQSDERRVLYSRMRLRIFPELMSKIPDKMIRDDIKADGPTKERLDNLTMKFRAERQIILKEQQALSKEYLLKRTAETAQLMKEFHEKYDAELHRILTAEQVERVQQVELQGRGSEALREPEITEWLGLTQPQLREVGRLNAERGQKVNELRKEAMNAKTKAEDAEFRKRKREIDTERNRKALDLLTDEQRRKYDDLIGKPFEFPIR